MNPFLRRLIKLFVLLLLLATLARLLLVFETVREQIFYIAEKFDLVKPFWMSSMKPLKDVPHGYKIILFYTSYFRTMPWPQTRGKEKKLTDPYGNKCRVSSCYISYSRKDFSNSNALVFHNSAMPTLKRMNSIFWRKPRSQKWVWYGGENPEKTFYSVKSYSGMFDVTITYRKDSDILDPYGYYVPISNSTNKLNALTNKSFSAGKDRLVLWLASNCVSFRLNIVKEIAKYIQVDVYGQCQYYFNHQRRDKCSRGSKDCDGLAKRYKFYLALENFNCKDYVTEKYWRNALGRDIVPVVVAGSYNKDILIPGSYIDILDFPNAKSLARYLEYLDSNDTAYNSYFEWKKKYTFTTTTNWLCDLCELLHKNTSTEVEKSLDFGKFWGKENCHADDSYIKNVWLRSGARGNGSLTLDHFMTIVMMIFYLL